MGIEFEDLAAAIQLAAETERKRIVEWLKGQAEKGFLVAQQYRSGGRVQRDHVAGVVSIKNAARLIEAGEHLVSETITPESGEA